MATELFTFGWTRPDRQYYVPDVTEPYDDIYFEDPDTLPVSDEPTDLPPFLIADLPDDLQEFARFAGGHAALDAALDAGVEEFAWRQPLKHLEENMWMSEEVFETLCELWDGQIGPGVSAVFEDPTGVRRRYYQQFETLDPFPYRYNEHGNAEEHWFVRDACIPPMPPDVYAYDHVKNAEGPVTLALPSWLDRDDRKVHIGSTLVTSGFVERWRRTDISQQLQADPWETDIVFTPSPTPATDRATPTPTWRFDGSTHPNPHPACTSQNRPERNPSFP